MSDDMAAEKKPRGRPMKKGYPPRIDATPEEIARAVLKGGLPTGRVKSRDYRCRVCGREFHYPETLYRDGRCPQCHASAPA